MDIIPNKTVCRICIYNGCVAYNKTLWHPMSENIGDTCYSTFINKNGEMIILALVDKKCPYYFEHLVLTEEAK